MKKVLVLGGGFAGVQAAIDLQKSKLFDVTLVSDRDFLFLYPISIWIPVHKINFNDAKGRRIGAKTIWYKNRITIFEFDLPFESTCK